MARRVLLSRRVRNWLDLESDYLAHHAPATLPRLRDIIDRAQILIRDFPRTGRAGHVPGTRRLVMVSYVLTYRQVGPDIVIVDIRHGRQRERPIPDR